MERTVVLRHDTPDGSHHYDWMLEPPDAPKDAGPHDRILIAWRLAGRPGPGARLAAERLPPHRLLYLDYEGPISGGRGSVTRIDGGRCRVVEDGVRSFAAVADLASGKVRCRGSLREGAWELEFEEE